MSSKSGVLYIVSTPIGNLADITERAREVLSSVDIVLAEDTRRTGLLLSNLGIKAKTIAFHEHNEIQKTAGVIKDLQQGQSIALVSDAGTPLIRDPGYPLLKACHEYGIRVSPIPGCCAAISALSASGIATDSFLFLGYLPAKRSARETELQQYTQQSATLIFYEAPHRVLDFMQSLLAVFPAQRQVCIAREITKTHEQFYHGSLARAVEALVNEEIPILGEFVIVLAGASKQDEKSDDQELRRILQILLDSVSVKQAVEIAIKLTGEKKNKLYALAVEINDDNT